MAATSTDIVGCFVVQSHTHGPPSKSRDVPDTKGDSSHTYVALGIGRSWKKSRVVGGGEFNGSVAVIMLNNGYERCGENGGRGVGPSVSCLLCRVQRDGFLLQVLHIVF